MITFQKIFIALTVTSLMTACRGNTSEESKSNGARSITLTGTGTEATAPYLTKDQLGNPVLCWTEKAGQMPENAIDQYALKYAIFNASTKEFGPAVTVGPSLGTRSSAESANKVAFKSDGSIVALFGKHFGNPRNRFAGAILYTISDNQGKTWSAPQYLHSDTLHSYGRSFFDLTTLPNGEAGAIWLDGRYGEADTGSALFFARTQKGEGFGPDKIIGESTCECCRTDILTDTAGVIHVAYRDIMFPSERFGKQVRDMVYSLSTDNGQTFSSPRRISPDNWEIEGCPHSGPSLAVGRPGLQAVWFTAGGGTGVYQASSADAGKHFTPRKLISAQARHPQMTALSGGRIAIVWEESTPGTIDPSNHTDQHRNSLHHPNHSTHSEEHAQPVASSIVVLQVQSASGETHSTHLTDGKKPAHHPVLTPLGRERLLVAWVEEENGIPGIKYIIVEL